MQKINKKVQDLKNEFSAKNGKKIYTPYGEIEKDKEIYKLLVNGGNEKYESNIDNRLKTINEDLDNTKIAQGILNNTINRKQILTENDKNKRVINYPNLQDVINEVTGINYEERKSNLEKLKKLQLRNHIIYSSNYGYLNIKDFQNNIIGDNDVIQQYIRTQIDTKDDINKQISDIKLLQYMSYSKNSTEGNAKENETVFKTLTRYKSSFPLSNFLQNSQFDFSIESKLEDLIKGGKSLLYSDSTKYYNSTIFNDEAIQDFFKQGFFNFVKKETILDNEYLVKRFKEIDKELRKKIYTELFNDENFKKFNQGSHKALENDKSPNKSNILKKLDSITIPAIDSLKKLKQDYQIKKITDKDTLFKQLVFIPGRNNKNIIHYIAQGIIYCIKQNFPEKDKKYKKVILQNFLKLINYFIPSFQMGQITNQLQQELININDYEILGLKNIQLKYAANNMGIIDITYTEE